MYVCYVRIRIRINYRSKINKLGNVQNSVINSRIMCTNIEPEFIIHIPVFRTHTPPSPKLTPYNTENNG